MPPDISIGAAAVTKGATTRDDARDLESGLDALQTDRTLGPRTWYSVINTSFEPKMLTRWLTRSPCRRPRVCAAANTPAVARE